MLRDVIWTLIVVWLVYKITGWFRTSTAQQKTNSNTHRQSPPHSGAKNRFDNEGEYVDFEEMK